MEYISGMGLDTLLEQFGNMPLKQIRQKTYRIALALSRLH
jgi:hypothetical protein